MSFRKQLMKSYKLQLAATFLFGGLCLAQSAEAAILGFLRGGRSRPAPEARELEARRTEVARISAAMDLQIETIDLSKSRSALKQRNEEWMNNKKCMSCHTGVTRALTEYDPNLVSIIAGRTDKLKAYESGLPYSEFSWGPAYQESKAISNEAVINAFSLVEMANRSQARELDQATKSALDVMIQRVKADGTVEWLDGFWELKPFESIGADYLGAAMARRAIENAPGGYAQGREASEKIKKQLIKNFDYLIERGQQRPRDLHGKIYAMWSNAKIFESGEMKTKANKVADELVGDLKLKFEDGSVAWSSLNLFTNKGHSERDRAQQSDLARPDAYATSIVLLSLMELGRESDIPTILAGLKWLHANQKQNGMWDGYSYALSVRNASTERSRRFVEDMATGYTILAVEKAKDAGYITNF